MRGIQLRLLKREISKHMLVQILAVRSLSTTDMTISGLLYILQMQSQTTELTELPLQFITIKKRIIKTRIKMIA
jgi:hypothetical protein